MSIRKHGRSWQVRLPGEPAKSFPTKTAAASWELNRKLARKLGEHHDEPPQTVAAMLDGHLERWQAREQPRASSVRRKHQHANFLKRQLGHMLLMDLRFVDVDDVVTARAGKHSNAAKKELELLKRGLREARRRGQQFDPELLNVEPIKDTSRVGRALDVDELDQLASWLPEQLARFALVGGTTAWRPGEGLALTDDRVDTDRGTIFVPAALNKEKRDKTIMLMPGEVLHLKEQLLLRRPGTRLLFPNPAGERWNENWFYDGIWHPACRAAAREWRAERNLPDQAATPFDGMVPHDLRHTGISLMARAGMRPEQIAERVGHKDGGALILRRYRHLFPDELRERLLAFEAFIDERREAGQAREAEEAGR
jgi:integrase